MYSISDEEYQHKYQATFNTVFSFTTQFQEFWFQPPLTHRLFIYPQIFSLNSSQLSTLAKAASIHAETEFILSITEIYGSEETKHWLISLNDFQAYHSVRSHKMLESVIFSTTGNWGIRFTQDFYAIVAGSELFVNSLVQYWPTDIKNDISQFLTDIKKESHINVVWLKAFLEHLYGINNAQQFLLEWGFV